MKEKKALFVRSDQVLIMETGGERMRLVVEWVSRKKTECGSEDAFVEEGELQSAIDYW